MGTPVIVEAVRTPIGKRNGQLAGLKAVEILRHAQVQVIERAGIEPSVVDEIIGGCVTQAGEQGSNVTRNAWLSTGLDYEVACTTVDAQCGSAQQANHLVAGLIAAGGIDVGIACGVEAMTRVPLGSAVINGPGHYKTDDYPWDDPPNGQFGAAQRIAENRGLTREDLDEWGAGSQQKAAVAWQEGRFEREIAPIEAPVLGDDGQPTGETQTVSRDGGLRETTAEGLAKLKPVIDGYMITAGNASQISDGAAATVVMSREEAEKRGLPILATIVAHGMVAGPDASLHEQPANAIKAALAKTDIKESDLNVVEINEAFACVGVVSGRNLNVDPESVNPNGGAIALGHPIGASGARLVVTLAHELKRRGGGVGAAALCGGGGQGDALIIRV
jgi:acetyl-CoA C-acetyltransferase